MWGSKTGKSSTYSGKDGSMSDIDGQEAMFKSPYLYIQMEYCPRLSFISISQFKSTYLSCASLLEMCVCVCASLCVYIYLYE